MIDRLVSWLFEPGDLLPHSRRQAMRQLLVKADAEAIAAKPPVYFPAPLLKPQQTQKGAA